jgi:DNA-binding transcriptional ArsR family regulator
MSTKDLIFEDLFEGLSILKTFAGLIKPLKNKKNKMVFDFLQKNKGEYSVTDIFTKLRIEQAEASQSLSKLKSLGLVIMRKDRKFRLYSINLKKLEEYEPILKDLKILEKKYFQKKS